MESASWNPFCVAMMTVSDFLPPTLAAATARCAGVEPPMRVTFMLDSGLILADSMPDADPAANHYGDREIAEALCVSVTTVRYHVGNLMGKTGFSSRTELAVKAVRSGITIPGIH